MARCTCSLCCGCGILPMGDMLIPCVDCDGKGYIEVDTDTDTDTDEETN